MKLATKLAPLFILAGLATASAQDYPNKVITVLVPYAPGGSTDAAVRLVVDKMKNSLKVPVIIENRPGAGTTVAAAALARAPKDGYTLGVISQSTAAIAPYLYSKVDYNLDSFTPISQVTRVPVMIQVRKDLPVANLKELIEYIKAKQPTAYGTPGAGTIAHLLGIMVSQSLKAEFTHVPYRGGAPALNDLVGGSLDIMIDSIGPATVAQHNAGGIRVLGAFGETRFEGFPNAPTFKEIGYPDIVGETYVGFVAPAGVPADVVRKVNEAVRAAVADPEVAKKLLEAGTPAQSSTPEEFDARMRKDNAFYGKLIKNSALPKVE